MEKNICHKTKWLKKPNYQETFFIEKFFLVIIEKKISGKTKLWKKFFVVKQNYQKKNFCRETKLSEKSFGHNEFLVRI